MSHAQQPSDLDIPRGAGLPELADVGTGVEERMKAWNGDGIERHCAT